MISTETLLEDEMSALADNNLGQGSKDSHKTKLPFFHASLFSNVPPTIRFSCSDKHESDFW